MSREGYMIVMLPIEVPASGYCYEGGRMCQFYSGECDVGFRLTGESFDQPKPEGCRRLKNAEV